MSRQFLGIHIDAVYHTSLVFEGVEYFFGQGIQTCYPGATHHGRPMEVISLGSTELPLEIVLEYLESMKGIYTPESYDLFMHNCNNFTHDFSMFLLGKGIPDHITSLPKTVLDTPFGQMLKPQLDSAMRGMTQAPVSASKVPPSRPPALRSTSNGTSAAGPSPTSAQPNGHVNGIKSPLPGPGRVHNVTRLAELDGLLSSARNSCAVIFFTSSTCGPCKIVYPAYDQLAEEAGSKSTLIKVDLNTAYEIGTRYKVRATPTFMTFLRGTTEEEWSGANESQLRSKVRMLVQMANPPHPHHGLRLRTLQRPHRKPVTYAKVPPLEKLIAKLGPVGNDLSVSALKDFIEVRTAPSTTPDSAPEPASAPLPPLPQISTFIVSSMSELAPDSLFPLIDLLRLSLVDPRVSGYFAEENTQPPHNTITSILSRINALDSSTPYTLRIVTLQTACNLFTSPLFPPQLLSNPALTAPLLTFLTTSLLDTEHAPVRVSAASLAFNISAFNHIHRLEALERGQEGVADLLPESAQVELSASLLEAIGREEESREGLKGLVLALGLLAYGSSLEGEVWDLLRVMGAKGILEGKRDMLKKEETLLNEVVAVLP
ncbi:hypothetical protein MMC09_003248 [Bachmanniomyces sp. S44760]|nr:hypothetical protein [Bachmanniomyces sp. S44760]